MNLPISRGNGVKIKRDNTRLELKVVSLQELVVKRLEDKDIIGS